MPTKTNDRRSGGIDDEQAVSGVFELLSARRRRFALHYLTTQVGAVPVSEVADQIALWERDHTRDGYERICTSLVHVHLPRLTDAGIVEYDPERETIELRERATVLTPYLDLAAEVDLR